MIEEQLVKLCILFATEEILGPEVARKSEAIPLSNSTVQQRIEDMAMNIEEQVIENVNMSPYFAIQK